MYNQRLQNDKERDEGHQYQQRGLDLSRHMLREQSPVFANDRKPGVILHRHGREDQPHILHHQRVTGLVVPHLAGAAVAVEPGHEQIGVERGDEAAHRHVDAQCGDAPPLPISLAPVDRDRLDFHATAQQHRHQNDGKGVGDNSGHDTRDAVEVEQRQRQQQCQHRPQHRATGQHPQAVRGLNDGPLALGKCGEQQRARQEDKTPDMLRVAKGVATQHRGKGEHEHRPQQTGEPHPAAHHLHQAGKPVTVARLEGPRQVAHRTGADAQPGQGRNHVNRVAIQPDNAYPLGTQPDGYQFGLDNRTEDGEHLRPPEKAGSLHDGAVYLLVLPAVHGWL